ncbi:uncharacterized protein LOC119963724 [Scyliorhinus canicula]|uniref:uncharacterized protein LOC119963724 n=1 Tax=Scyliorhinus canicula TaxID=7830 RepID=UPI0018F365AD|nr:uncharacterized protein LOC119963724 [Scyliorhinus canicula]
MMYLDKTERGYQKFQRIAKIVKTICGINLVLKGYIQKAKVIRWVAYHLTRQLDLGKELLFNIHNFTKNKSERDSAKLNCLLSVPSHLRSIQEIATVQSLLRKNQAFRCLPHIVQLEVCRVAVYQQYEAKTMVVRKGHQPEACYFLLTGELVATLSDSCSENQNHLTEVLNEIQEGDLFGDAALLTNTKRPATILCKTNAELLLINKEDFESVLAGFLQERYHAVTDLLRSLPIFTPWTPEKLTLLSYSSLLRYYRSGTAVVPESSSSSFIVVVKSGRCDIVTNLRMDRCVIGLSQSSQQKKQTMIPKNLSLLEENTKLSEKSPQSASSSSGLTLADAQEATKTHQTRKSRCTRMTTSSCSVLEEGIFEELESPGLNEQLSNIASSSTEDMQRSVSLTPTLTKNSAATHIPENAVSEHKEIVLGEPDCTDRSPSSRSAELSHERLITPEEDYNEMQDDIKPFGNYEEVEQQKEKNKDQSVLIARPPENASSTFVKIGTMEQGGIFGLTEIPGSTCNLQLSLVSDGAEYIFIPKKLFLTEAPVISRHVALELVNTYPTEQTIRQNLARLQEWNLYKARLIKQLLEDRVKRRPVSTNPRKTTF